MVVRAERKLSVVIERPTFHHLIHAASGLGSVPERPRHDPKVEADPGAARSIGFRVMEALVAPKSEDLASTTFEGGEVATPGETLDKQAVRAPHRCQRHPKVQLFRHMAVVRIAMRHRRDIRRGHHHPQDGRHLHRSLDATAFDAHRSTQLRQHKFLHEAPIKLDEAPKCRRPSPHLVLLVLLEATTSIHPGQKHAFLQRGAWLITRRPLNLMQPAQLAVMAIQHVTDHVQEWEFRGIVYKLLLLPEDGLPDGRQQIPDLFARSRRNPGPCLRHFLRRHLGTSLFLARPSHPAQSISQDSVVRHLDLSGLQSREELDEETRRVLLRIEAVMTGVKAELAPL
mmetsp:Transcript_106234/g.307488  ORF Transcript_106234/g.307488 Transcript_106234/m.307488 type:complete len:341 (+) Transcript_106234:157-1179(+)